MKVKNNMTEYTLEQLIDVDQVRQLLESHSRLSGMAYDLFCDNENSIVSVGWQEIFMPFHGVPPLCSERRRESGTHVASHVFGQADSAFEYRWGNGMIGEAMPIIIEGRHLATFSVGQFCYEDDPIDRTFVIAAARESGFDRDLYLTSLEKVPVLSRDYIRANLTFLHSMVRALAESGLKTLRAARDITERVLMEARLRESEARYRHSSNLLASILESAACVGVSALDREYRYLAFNWRHRKWVKRFWDTDIAIGMSMLDAITVEKDRELCRRSFDYVLESRSSHFIESRHMVNKDGQQMVAYRDNYASPVFNDDGVAVGLTVFSINTTERKRMEEVLRRREQEFRTLVENSPDMVARYGRDHRRLYVNPAFADLADGGEAALLGRTPSEYPGGANASLHERNLEKVFTTGKALEFEFVWNSKNSREICSLVNMTPEFGSDGTVESILAIGRNITEFKDTSRKLQESHALMRQLLQTMPDIVWLKDLSGRYLFCNQAFEEFFGAGESEIIGKTGYDCFNAEQAESWNEKDREALISKGVLFNEEWIVYKDSGRGGVLETRRVPMFGADGDLIGILGIAHDITERRRMEEQLRFSEQQFRTLAENSPGMIVRFDRECRRIYVNPAFTRETQIPASEALGLTPEDVWMKGANVSSGEYMKFLQRVMETAAPADIQLEWPNRETGRLSCHLMQFVPEGDADGKIIGCLAIDHDITRLRETELKLAKLAESAPGALFSACMTCDGSFRMPYASRHIGELIGLSHADIEHDLSTAFDLVHPDDSRNFMESIMESARTLSQWHQEFREIHPIKGEVWLEANSIPELQPDGNIMWYGYLHDITERKNSEELLNTKRKQLAELEVELCLAEERERQYIATVLHDHIGQTLLLSCIKLDTLSEELLPDPCINTLRETKELIEQVTHDIHNLTVQINPPLLATAGLEAALEWLGRRMEEDYGLLVEFEDDLCEKPLRDEIRSVIYQCGRELLINIAKHAKTNHARIEVARQDDFYRLTVVDGGIGFNLSKLAPGISKDCRFGLLSIQIRMERMGGRVVFESAPGQGCRMTLFAPISLD